FVALGGPDGNPSPNLGLVSPVAPLGADTSDQVGFDISPNGNTGFASVTVGGAPYLVRLSLTAGSSLVGPIGDGSIAIRGLPLSTPPPASTLFAVTATNQLLSFSSALPGIIQSTTPITGLQGGETIRGIDTRPTTGQLYALGSTSRLYTIDPATG